MRLTDRIDLAMGRGLTLGRLMEMVAGVHPKRVLVTEAGDGLRLTATMLPSWWTVGRRRRGAQRGGRPGHHRHAERLRAVPPHARRVAAGRLPAPVNGQIGAGRDRPRVADSGASLVIRSTDDVASDEPFGPR